IADEVVELEIGEALAVPEGDARATGEPRGDGHVGEAVVVHVAHGGAGSAAEVRGVDAEVADHLGEAAARVNVDPRAAALIRRRDEFGLAVAGDVAGREEDAALERIEWEGREQRGAIGSAE